MRPSDYGPWAAGTAAFPAAFFAWEMADPSAMTQKQLRLGMRGAGILDLFGGFLFAYQRSSLRFFRMSENKREDELDLQELTQRAKEGKSLYGESPQPQWVQSAAHQNSVWTQFKFCKSWMNPRCLSKVHIAISVISTLIFLGTSAPP
ncbi:NADH-ubiquinone oxidoreductase complex I, 21 kDa subunit-domain-containing protein [Armillaria luteobubalina]|uniref:NADH-ubiquinone oxidoreductase complex I, 21 kDa subunit-domain-containing protein n=1 Tax=Armillaria luteobubalina TaxID=153913 RepID=A0AA39PH80_9AGAR|nr:NADH-ubiquinone oxidoreductase complex I, 21 kDa subunit-domain-containing protein [Armillaria luteobubalina]